MRESNVQNQWAISGQHPAGGPPCNQAGDPPATGPCLIFLGAWCWLGLVRVQFIS